MSLNEDIKTFCANERQVAGEHYKAEGFQHWDMVAAHKLDYFQGQITKYVMRWNKKGGIQDLHKAHHFLEKYIELVKAGTIPDPMIKTEQPKVKLSPYHDQYNLQCGYPTTKCICSNIKADA